MFYSLAMKCFRITYYQRGITYHVCRESSFHMERMADAELVQSILDAMPVDSWESWLKFVEAIRVVPADRWKGYVYVYGVDMTRTVVHG